MLTQISPHTWVIPHSPQPTDIQPSVGVISDGEQTILYDCGQSPAQGHQIQQMLAEAGLPPVSLIIYSHAHWDHIFGAQAFANVPILAHHTCWDAVQSYATRAWNPQALQQRATQHPNFVTSAARLQAIIPDWQAFQIRMPTQRFEATQTTLTLKNVQVVVEHIGGWHAPESTVVQVIEDSVMFLADCYYPNPANYGADTPDGSINTAMMQTLLDRQQAWYVDGHMGVMSHEKFTKLHQQVLGQRVP